jgi:hypothetical protein
MVFAFGLDLGVEYLNDSGCVVDDFLKAVFAERIVIHEIFTFLL